MNSLTEANPLIPLALINPGFKHVPRLLRCIGVERENPFGSQVEEAGSSDLCSHIQKRIRLVLLYGFV
jgi:hypothetical protein